MYMYVDMVVSVYMCEVSMYLMYTEYICVYVCMYVCMYVSIYAYW